MSRLQRYTQLIFGSSAGNNQMAEYGSLVASPPGNLYSGSTITPAIVQQLTNYLEGQYAAVSGAYSPTIQDHNSLFYLFAYQLAYLMQEGIAEWDSATSYYIGSITQDGAGTLYSSKTDTNLNNALTSGTNWGAPKFPGIKTPNTVPYSTGMTLDANYSLMWPYMAIGNGQTVVVPDNAQLIGVTSIILTGTAVLQSTGTGIVRAI